MTNCSHKKRLMSTCSNDVDMFTLGRIVSCLPKHGQVDWDWPISWKTSKNRLVCKNAVVVAEPHNYRNRITCMHRNRNPCNSFLMVKMDRGRVRPTTTSRNMAALLGLIISLAALVESTPVETRYPLTKH